MVVGAGCKKAQAAAACRCCCCCCCSSCSALAIHCLTHVLLARHIAADHRSGLNKRLASINLRVGCEGGQQSGQHSASVGQVLGLSPQSCCCYSPHRPNCMLHDATQSCPHAPSACSRAVSTCRAWWAAASPLHTRYAPVCVHDACVCVSGWPHHTRQERTSRFYQTGAVRAREGGAAMQQAAATRATRARLTSASWIGRCNGSGPPRAYAVNAVLDRTGCCCFGGKARARAETHRTLEAPLGRATLLPPCMRDRQFISA